jgi:hypothetical protein
MLAALRVLHVDPSHAPAKAAPIEERLLMAYQAKLTGDRGS